MRNPSSSSGSAASKSTPTPCCSKVGLKRGPWTPEEDEVLANYIRREGEGRWRTLPKRAGLLRCGKSCRLRWMNYLRPSVKRGPIAPDEEDLILRLHRLLGNRWALIAGRIPGRTDNEIKNYWNTHLSKKLINQGLDPRTHKPLNPNPNPNPNPNSSRIVYFATPNRPNPNPNPNPNISDHENCYQATVNKSSDDSKVTNLDKYQNPLVNTSDHHENCQNSSVGLMSTGLQSNHGNGEHEIEFCNEDTFSSFLNSLINEDVFGNQQYQQQANAAIAPPASSSLLQPVILPPSVQTFNHGTIWEAALTSSNMAGLGDEQNRFN